MRFRGMAAPIAAVILIAACGGKGPTAPSVTASSVTISTANDMVRVSETVQFDATALQPDGTSKTVTDWSSNSPAILGITSAGSATGQKAGFAILTARNDNVTATRSVQVVPDYQGTWAGQFVVSGCRATGDYTTFCSETLGESLPMSIVLSQNRATISGTISFYNFGGYDYSGPVGGPISSNGLVDLSGSAILGVGTMTITSWATTVLAPDSMTGTFSVRMTSSVTGSALLTCSLGSVTRSASVIAR